MCNFLEYKGESFVRLSTWNYRRSPFTDTKVVYRRYASLFFICGISSGDNELITLEIIHRYVEVLDRYFGNVSITKYCEYSFILTCFRFVNLTCMLPDLSGT